MSPVGIALVGTGFALRVQLPALRLVPEARVNVLVGTGPLLAPPRSPHNMASRSPP